MKHPPNFGKNIVNTDGFDIMSQLFQPQTLEQALQLLAQHPDARIVSGGTDIHGAPETLISISQIPGLDYIREEGDYIRLGARVTHAQVIASDLLNRLARPLVRACSFINDAKVREHGTIAGNLASGLSTNLTVAALWAMGAEVKLKSARGERVVTFNDFFKGVRQTTLAPGEMIVEVAFSKMSPKDKGTFVCTGWSEDESAANVTCAVVLEFEDDEISNAWINLGGIAPTVVNAIEAEQALVGQWLSDAVIHEAADLAVNAIVTRPDATETVRELVTRALREIRDG
jgi:CO/xanthine dehydrogenase FAD-binding subunit